MSWQERTDTAVYSAPLLGGLFVMRIWQRKDQRWILAIYGNRRATVYHREAHPTAEAAKAAAGPFLAELAAKMQAEVAQLNAGEVVRVGA